MFNVQRMEEAKSSLLSRIWWRGYGRGSSKTCQEPQKCWIFREQAYWLDREWWEAQTQSSFREQEAHTQPPFSIQQQQCGPQARPLFQNVMKPSCVLHQGTVWKQIMFTVERLDEGMATLQSMANGKDMETIQRGTLRNGIAIVHRKPGGRVIPVAQRTAGCPLWKNKILWRKLLLWGFFFWCFFFFSCCWGWVAEERTGVM